MVTVKHMICGIVIVAILIGTVFLTDWFDEDVDEDVDDNNNAWQYNNYRKTAKTIVTVNNNRGEDIEESIVCVMKYNSYCGQIGGTQQIKAHSTAEFYGYARVGEFTIVVVEPEEGKTTQEMTVASKEVTIYESTTNRVTIEVY